jgi:hypothetical protein
MCMGLSFLQDFVDPQENMGPIEALIFFEAS